MCLYIDNDSIEKTKSIKEKRAGQTVIRYKVLEWSDYHNSYVSPIMGTKVKARLTSDRKSNTLIVYEVNGGQVNCGIHVYTNKSHAKAEFGVHSESIYTIFEAKCNIDDLVCCGSDKDDITILTSPNEEVYTKIYIPELDKKVKKEKTGEKNMIKWNDILGKNGKGQYRNVVEQFAREEVSRDEFLTNMSGVPGIRNLVRDHGVAEARRIARKALRRRNVTI